MEFIIFRKEWDKKASANGPAAGLALRSMTSVEKLKAHLFKTLGELGTITVVDDEIGVDALVRLASKPGVILVPFLKVFPWFSFPHRVLAHSLGDYLLPHVFFAANNYAPNTTTLVTSDVQAERIRNHLHQAAPRLCTFSPTLDERDLYPPNPKEKRAARKKYHADETDFHIVYAGRWLSSKGICQLIRALNLWPLKKTKITLAGNFEPDFHLYQTSASHFNFEHYFDHEVVVHNQVPLETLKAQDPDGLRELFWSADLFVYPSVHEDENFGIVPREAVLCGTPVLTSDFCGLKTVGDTMPWGPLSTYATLAGPRFSLFELGRKIKTVLKSGGQDLERPIQAIRSECDYQLAKSNLKKACEELAREPLAKVPGLQQMEKTILHNLYKYAEVELVNVLLKEESSPLPDGVFTDGGAPVADRGKMGLLQAVIQGFYTTSPVPPEVETNTLWRGFWRVAAWPDECKIIEFGFPGPRIKQYSEKEWKNFSPAFTHSHGETTICPRTKIQVQYTQELVDMGYLVPDAPWRHKH